VDAGTAEDAGGAADPAGDEPDVVGLLERLAEQSLVRIEEDAHGDLRFTMLETLREYAAERLQERRETRLLGDRHAAAVLAMVETGDDGGADPAAWLDRLADEHDNIRAAIDHSIETGDSERAAALVFACWRFWQMRGHVVEGRRRINRVLAMPGWTAERSRSRLRALEAAGGLAYWAGDMTRAGEHYAASAAEARRLGDDGEIANALYNHWFTRRPTANVEDWGLLLAGDDRELLDEALEIWTRIGDELGVAKALWGLGEHFAYREDYPAAEEVSTRALEIFERTGDRFWIAWTRFTRSFARTLGGDLRGSAADYAVCLRAFRASRDVSGLCLTMAAMSSLLLAAQRMEDAYALGAAAERAVAETGLHIASLWPSPSLKVPDTAHAEGELREAVERGRGWTREEALEVAIAIADDLAAALPEGPAGRGTA
jgi:tetratricopeptide (TPR) repeat protein